jgi:hypothetical protein
VNADTDPSMQDVPGHARDSNTQATILAKSRYPMKYLAL